MGADTGAVRSPGSVSGRSIYDNSSLVNIGKAHAHIRGRVRTRGGLSESLRNKVASLYGAEEDSAVSIIVPANAGPPDPLRRL